MTLTATPLTAYPLTAQRLTALRLGETVDVPNYLAAGKSPELVADFYREYYRADSANTDFDTLFTFSRASTATYVDSTGTLQTAASGEARRNHHVYEGSKWVNKGLLIESESRTNLITHSEDFSDASWTKSNCTVTANDAAAPDGNDTADLLTATAANATAKAAVTTTADPFTFSIYLKRKTGTGDVDITMDGTTWATQTISDTVWTRVYVAQTGVAGTSNPGIRLVTSGDEVWAWGGQAE